MKKCYLFAITLLLSFQGVVEAKTIVPLRITEIHNPVFSNPTPKDGGEIPIIGIEDQTLYFQSSHPDYILTILNADRVVEFTCFVDSEATEVTLPLSLEGEYTLEISDGVYTYRGLITL